MVILGIAVPTHIVGLTMEGAPVVLKEKPTVTALVLLRQPVAVSVNVKVTKPD
jgi:hypothetical protein